MCPTKPSFLLLNKTLKVQAKVPLKKGTGEKGRKEKKEKIRERKKKERKEGRKIDAYSISFLQLGS